MKRLLVLFLALIVFGLAAGCEVTNDGNKKKAMSYSEFVAAELDSEVTVDTYIQARQSFWTDEKGQGLASFYTQGKEEGAYFLYNLPCTEEKYNSELVVGAHILVTGKKAEWAGEVEIIEAKYELLEGTYDAPAVDLTDKLGDEDFAKYVNVKAEFKSMQVVARKNDAGEFPFMYKWNNSGSQGDDLYFDLTDGKATYTFVVESYLCDKTTDVYQKVESLQVGDYVNVKAFMYWYEGPQPHVFEIVTLK